MMQRGRVNWGTGMLLGVVLAATAASAETVRVTLEFTVPTLHADGVIEMPGCVTQNEPGLPLLPARGSVVLLPPGEGVSAVRAERVVMHAIAGQHHVPQAQTPRPISAPGPFAPTPPDARVYGADAASPDLAARLVTVQTGWGHGLAFLRAAPVTWNPVTGELAWCERIEIAIETAPLPGVDPARLPNLRTGARVDERLGRLVANPEDLARYAGAGAALPAGSRLEPDFYPYVIVTTEAFAAGFGELAAFESSRGLRARIVLLSEIAAQYAGVDLAEQLRNFILDAYQNWQTEYVMLGGDNGIVPVRNLYVDAGGTIDAFPGDCYFEGLDGTWNADGDDRWGEYGNEEYDLVGEIAVGRASIDDPTQLANWLHKNLMYTERPVVSEIEKALFLGERLDDTPTYGDDYMDKVKDYTCYDGYCTSGYPNDYEKSLLYDRVGWTAWDAINRFNSGFPTSHHLGHSNTTYNMRLNNGDVQYFTNDGVAHSYMFVSTQGCYANNFDSNSPDSFSEVFFYDEHACAAFLGCTRYGWYCPGWPTGPSQHFDRQFVDACYGEGMTTAGWMNVDSKVDCVWLWDPWMQWCHYELCLLGDPALPQWRHLAGTLAMEHEGGFVVGQGAYPVTVRSGGAPVAGATVTAYSDDLAVWASAVSGGDGVAVLHPAPGGPMTLRLKAVGPDYLPAADSLAVAPSSGPWVVLSATALDDAAGDGDGLADAGETLLLRLELYNAGVDPASGVALSVACADPRVTLSDATAAYGTLPGGARGWNLDDLVASIAGAIPDGEEIAFTLSVTADGRPVWDSGFHVTVHAPILSLAGWTIDDAASGDGQGDADPGESFDLRVTLANAGSGEARGVQAILACGSAYLELSQSESGCALIDAGGAAGLEPPFGAALLWTAPTDSVLHFDLQVTTAVGQTATLEFDVPVASVFEDELEAENGWRVGSPTDNATQGIWVRVDPIGTFMGGRPVQPEDDHTLNGTQCFVTGQGVPGQPALASDVDGGRTTLNSPLLDLRGAHEPRLVYWRWYTNNIGSYPGEDVWKVQISDDGGMSWLTLEETTQSANEWRRMEFDLTPLIDLTDRVRVRFVASDQGGDSVVEAAVDDVAIETTPFSPQGVDDAAAPVAFGLRALAPNPLGAGAGLRVVYGLPARTRVALEIFGVDGGLVRTLDRGLRAAGEHRLVWDRRNDAGAPQPSGVYFLRLRAGEAESRARLVVVR